MDTIDPVVSIPAFYANRSIFVTGGTGFMGKILIEKLLRSCPDVREIFVLLRPKKHLDVHERLKELINVPAFDKIRKERPSSFEKLIPVNGDISAPENLGLSLAEKQMLIERVSIIFHVAANVRFDDNLTSIILTNIRGTRNICILAGEMKNLVALTYYGTAYSQTDKAVIDEAVYPIKVDWRQLIATAERVDEHILNIFSLKYIDGFPNTYSFTKRVAEQILMEYSALLPCIIVRPTIVWPSINEPEPGYIDNFNGPFTLMLLIGKGILRVAYCDEEIKLNNAAVDDCTNLAVAATWKRGITKFARNQTPSIYNCVTNEVNFVSLSELFTIANLYFEKKPLENVLLPVQISCYKSRFVYHTLLVLYHLLPAILIDSILMLRNRKPMMLQLQKKVHATSVALSYYMFQKWTFKAQNVVTLWNTIPLENKNSFSFGSLCNKIDLDQYSVNVLEGVRKYLLKEDRNKHELNLKHYKRMCLIYNITRSIFFIITVWIMYRNGVFYWLFNICSYILKNLIFRQILM